MSDGTHIEWTDATWNIINGCSVVSPGCTNCYAMKLAGTRLKHIPSRVGLTIDTKAGPVWTGETRFNEPVLLDPIKWKRPRKIFVCAHGDLFHDSVPDEWIDKVFAAMALAPQHQFQVLTKRSKRMREYMTAFEQGPDAFGAALASVTRLAGLQFADGLAVIEDMHWPLANVWLGVSVEDQQRAEERIDDLLGTPAAVRWVSAEPLLGPLRLDRLTYPESHYIDALEGYAWDDVNGGLNAEIFNNGGGDGPKLDWIVAGGESGPGSRPMHIDWVRALRDQCAREGTAFLMKQWGSHDQDGKPAHKAIAGRVLDGVTHDGYPT